MSQTLCSFRSIAQILGLVLFLGAFAVPPARAQDAASARPTLDIEGHKVFSKDELLDTTNKCLDQWLETAYTTENLHYCLHKLTGYLRSKGYLQARLEKTLYNQTDSGTKALIRSEEHTSELQSHH